MALTNAERQARYRQRGREARRLLERAPTPRYPHLDDWTAHFNRPPDRRNETQVFAAIWSDD